MTNILLALFYLFFPVVIIWATSRFSILEKIGAAILSYGVGMAISAMNIIPKSAAGIQELFMTITVPLSIILMLFTIDLKRWSRLAGKTFLSMVLMFSAVLTVAFTAFILFRERLDDAWKIAGMAIGVYTGGTANLNAIGLALKAEEHVLVLTNTADMLACTPWFFFNMLFAQKLFNRFLPPFKPAVVEEESPDALTKSEVEIKEDADLSSFKGIFKRDTLIPLLGAIGIAVVIFGIGGGIYSVAPKDYNMAILMLVITTLAIGCSFIPRIRNIDKTFQVGQYLIYIFCIVVGSMADVGKLFTAAIDIVIFISLIVYGSWILHVILSAVFRIDTDTVIITSVAALFSPPFVPVFATALKNKEIIVSGITAGIIGYAIGNYVGITFAYFLKGFL